MFPTIFSISTVEIHSYGVLIALGVLCAFRVFFVLGKRRGIDTTKLIKVGILTTVSALIGAKLLYVVTVGSWSDINFRSGFVFYGVPLFGIPTFWFAARLFKLPALVGADIAVIGICLAQSIGRLGCFFAGCCYGRPTTSSWSVKLYSALVPESLHGIPLQPVQLYSAISEFILFLALLFYFRGNRRPGETALLYFIGYAFLRFGQEFLRGDDYDRGIWAGISTSQIISIAIVLVGLPVFLKLHRQKA